MMKLAFYRADAPKRQKADPIVNFYTGGYGYSHVELVFSNDLSFSASPREGECRFKDIDIYKEDTWVVVPLSETRYNQNIEALAWEEAHRLAGKKYDWKGILLNQVMHLGIDEPDKWWCSEVAMWLLRSFPFKISPNEAAKRFGAPSLEQIRTRSRFHDR